MAGVAPAPAVTDGTDGFCWSGDGVRLHWREWAGPADRPTLLCIPGLTRNARDFAELGARLAGAWRVVAVDLRGRGESGWARDALTYVPLTYAHDLAAVIAAANIGRFAVIGNSLGGLIGLRLVLGHDAAIAGLVLNDIGPDMAAAGLERLRGNVGRGGNWPTWVHAARDLATRNAAVHPDWQLADWLAFAKRLCRVATSGRIVFNYDPRIAEPFRLKGSDAGADDWLALERLADRPILSLRGARSDVFGQPAQAAMQRRIPGITAVTIAGVGHAPTLSEPAAVAALDRFLDKLAGETK